MNAITRLALSSSVIALLGLAGCQDDVLPTDPERPGPEAASDPSQALRRSEQAIPRPHEAMFHKIASQVKGFGGYFYDEEGNMVVYLVDGQEEDVARKLLEPIIRGRDVGERERNTGQILVKKADFSFLELASYRDRATDPVFEQFGVEWTDLDEMQNRFVVGVSTSSARESVLKVLEEHRIPTEAVAFEETSRIMDQKSLRDRSRPIEGGYQIQRSGGWTCTLGFNAYSGGYASFLTNSHCTSSVWSNGGTSEYQNVVAGGNLVGTEVKDPAPFNCGFFGLFKCRWSDAAVIRKTSGVSWNYGKIARTTFWGSPGNIGSITIDDKNPRMTIIGEYSFPTGGEMFDKMGRTTGWTYGFVKKTCVDMAKSSYPGGWGRIICQDWANYRSDNGDSGSPVFRWYGSTVRLAGIHWGGITQSGTQYALLSAMWNIEKDLGALSTF
jgi:hypothetical protein